MKRAILGILAGGVCACHAFAAEPLVPTCGPCGHEISWTHAERWRISYTPNSGPTCCAVSCAALCMADEKNYICEVGHSDNDSESDSHSGGCSTVSASTSATALGMDSSASGSVTGLDLDASTSSEGVSYHGMSKEGCDDHGVYDRDGIANGIFIDTRSYCVHGPLSYTRRFNFDTTWTIRDDAADCPNPSCGGDFTPPTYMIRAIFVNDQIGINGTKHATQGVFAIYSDNTVVRLGIFTNSAFAPTSTATGGSVSADIQFNGSLGGSADLTVTDDLVIGDAFSNFDGDLDGDQMTCWTDLDALDAILGSSIGDATYNARADFNLDGVIDGDDRAVLLAMVKCNQDTNCDGSTGTDADIDAFFAALSNSTAAADFNGDGDVGTDGDIDSFFSVLGGGPC